LATVKGCPITKGSQIVRNRTKQRHHEAQLPISWECRSKVNTTQSDVKMIQESIKLVKESIKNCGDTRSQLESRIERLEGETVQAKRELFKVNNVRQSFEDALKSLEEAEGRECKHDWVEIIQKDKDKWEEIFICMKCFEVEAGVLGIKGN